MNRTQAIKLGIRALETQRHRIAVDAELADVYGATYPHAQTASRTRKDINEAIEELRKILAEIKAAKEKPILDELKRKKQRAEARRQQPVLFEEMR